MAGPVIPRDRMIDAVAPTPTRKPALEYPNAPVAAKVVAKVKEVVKKSIALHGRVLTDDQYGAELLFSLATGDGAGSSYAADMVDPKPKSLWYWRLRITQHRVDPLLQGFATTWYPPPGWSFKAIKGVAPGLSPDNLPVSLLDEAVSNPLVITRVIRAPASPNAAIGFRVVVTRKYLP